MNDGMIIQQLLFCSVSKHRHISERRLTRKKPSSSQSFLGLLFYSHDATTHLALPVWFSNMNPFICQATLSMLVIRGDSNQLCVFFSVRLEIHVWVWWKSWFVFECACWVSVNLWRLQLLSFFQHSNAASPQLLVRNTAQEEQLWPFWLFLWWKSSQQEQSESVCYQRWWAVSVITESQAAF